jgi:beta-glucanase (GH16 family)
LLPKRNDYGTWPASGEIDLVESRGNKNLIQNGKNIGVKTMHSTLHYGPYSSLNSPTSFVKVSEIGFDEAFHKYQMEWTPGK